MASANVRRYCGALPALKICAAAALHRKVPVALSPSAASLPSGNCCADIAMVVSRRCWR